MTVKLKRAYEKAAADDGIRVLVDRFWPRGVSKEKLNLESWMKEVAPSAQLCKWFNHDSEKFDEFKQKYQEELQSNPEQQEQLEVLRHMVSEQKQVTLVYGAKDEVHNQAAVLKELLEEERCV